MENITLKEAINKLTNRREANAEENLALYNGDHLRKEKDYSGYIGILPQPGDAEYSFVVKWLERIFAATNLVKSAVNRNLDGCLSREPDWNLIFPDTVAETTAEKLSEETTGANGSLIDWWNENSILQTVIREAGKTVLLEGECYLRPIIPVAMRDEKGNIAFKKTLADALNLLDFEILTADKAGIFTDKETGQKFSICRLETDKQKEVEISWIGEDGLTYLKILREDGLKAWTESTLPTIAAQFSNWKASPGTMTEPLDLGGRLYLQKITREMLITEPARSLQRSVNYSLTTMNKNLNIAGGRDTYVKNAQRPKKRVETKDAEGNVTGYTEEDESLVKGSSNANFLAGFPIYDETGEHIINYTTADVTTVDPVAVDTFVKAFEVYRLLFLDEVSQAHILNNEIAALSGKSKQESKSEFKTSLNNSKIAIDPAGRYVLEVALKLAAAFSNRSADFARTRFDFNCQITAGAVDLKEIKQEAADVEAGLSSPFDYQVIKGKDDPDAALERIQKSPGYDLAHLAKAIEVMTLSAGAIDLKTAVELSAMTEDGKKKVLEMLATVKPTPNPAPTNGLPASV